MCDKYYFITLIDNELRKNNVEEQIHKHSIKNYVIWEAINLNTFNIKPKRDFSIGMISCFLSHIQVWKEGIHNQYDSIIVLEDDVFMNEDFSEQLSNVLNSLPEDYDFAFLGYYKHTTNKIDYIDNEHWQLCSSWHGAHCYLINLKSMKDKIYLFNDMKYQIDFQIRYLSNKNNINTYFLKDSIAHQIGFDTTVQKQLYDINNMYKNDTNKHH